MRALQLVLARNAVITKPPAIETRIRNNEYIDFDAHHVINFVGVTYHHSKKDIPKTFYVDVFNMIAVALTNFRRNLKNQALK